MQLLFWGMLPPGFVTRIGSIQLAAFLCNCRQAFSLYALSASMRCIHIVVLAWKNYNRYIPLPTPQTPLTSSFVYFHSKSPPADAVAVALISSYSYTSRLSLLPSLSLSHIHTHTHTHTHIYIYIYIYILNDYKSFIIWHFIYFPGSFSEFIISLISWSH